MKRMPLHDIKPLLNLILFNFVICRSNQKQIHRIDEVMRSRGLTTIVDTDSQHLAVTPQHKMKICQNIDECESILIFVTSKFMGKVNGMDGNNDICKVEYEHALRTASSKLVIVILEERMKFLSQWKGALRYVRKL